MPRLILLNGPPGCGKSTVAQMYVDDHPLALNLDIDVVRGMLGRWLDAPGEGGVLARALAVAMARTHLLGGHDVVVPQYLGRLPFIEELEALAVEVGARFVEAVLMDSKENLLRRFVARSDAAVVPAHRDATALLERSGGLSRLGPMYDHLVALAATRPNARVIRAEEGSLSETYRALLGLLDEEQVGT